jgi:solute carrier family 35 protein E1
LSPLFTVCAYAFLFGVSYSFATYLSLLPLTLGVMLACSFDMSASNAFGLVCAFGSTLVFVSSNIVFKKLMPSHPGGGSGSSGATSAGEGRLDKINLLYYSSGMAFLLMVPIWLSSDVSTLLSMWLNPAANTTAPIRVGSASTLSVLVYFFLNGTVHFAQNYLAFAILSSTSPVTYSIASLVKRIAVICLAILWFNQAVHPVQAVGIALTGIGLYMYNNAKRDVERGEKKIRHMEAVKEGMLPMTKADQRLLDSSREGSPDVESVGGKGGPHASPRPTYLDISSVSVSSAVKSNGFSLPSPAFPLATSNGTLASVLGGVGGHPAGSGPQPQVTMSMSISEPYPSPPPSNASSPPFSSISVPSAVGTEYPATPYNPSSKPTRRRLSNENSHVKPDSMVSKPAAAQALHQHLPNVPAAAS